MNSSTPKILLSLQPDPVTHREAWSDAANAGDLALAVVQQPLPTQRRGRHDDGDRTTHWVELNAARARSREPGAETCDRPASGTDRWGTLAAGIERLNRAGVQPLGHVSLGYAIRPLPEILDEITRWAVLPVRGIFLDHAPASPYQIGPVVQAVRACRRCGLSTIVLNPGGPVDPLYRRLGVTICTFEGSWAQYAEGADEAEAGDGHLVFEVPRSEWDAARTLSQLRHAGLTLVTDRSAPEPT